MFKYKDKIYEKHHHFLFFWGFRDWEIGLLSWTGFFLRGFILLSFGETFRFRSESIGRFSYEMKLGLIWFVWGMSCYIRMFPIRAFFLRGTALESLFILFLGSLESCESTTIWLSWFLRTSAELSLRFKLTTWFYTIYTGSTTLEDCCSIARGNIGWLWTAEKSSERS